MNRALREIANAALLMICGVSAAAVSPWAAAFLLIGYFLAMSGPARWHWCVTGKLS